MITDHCSLMPPLPELLMSGGEEGLVPGPGDETLREASVFLGYISPWLTHCPEPQETVGRGSNESVTEKPPSHLADPLPPDPGRHDSLEATISGYFCSRDKQWWVES